MSAQRNWLRLYRWARASRTINPNLQADMLIGLIKPAPCLIEMLDRMNDMNFTTASGTTFSMTMNARDISATARGLTFSVVFDGKNIESRFPIREAGNNKIVAPVPAANLAEVSAMFEKLAANIAARMADDAEYDAHVAGVKKMMNA